MSAVISEQPLMSIEKPGLAVITHGYVVVHVCGNKGTMLGRCSWPASTSLFRTWLPSCLTRQARTHRYELISNTSSYNAETLLGLYYCYYRVINNSSDNRDIDANEARLRNGAAVTWSSSLLLSHIC